MTRRSRFAIAGAVTAAAVLGSPTAHATDDGRDRPAPSRCGVDAIPIIDASGNIECVPTCPPNTIAFPDGNRGFYCIPRIVFWW